MLCTPAPAFLHSQSLDLRACSIVFIVVGMKRDRFNCTVLWKAKRMLSGMPLGCVIEFD